MYMDICINIHNTYIYILNNVYIIYNVYIAYNVKVPSCNYAFNDSQSLVTMLELRISTPPPSLLGECETMPSAEVQQLQYL